MKKWLIPILFFDLAYLMSAEAAGKRDSKCSSTINAIFNQWHESQQIPELLNIQLNFLAQQAKGLVREVKDGAEHKFASDEPIAEFEVISPSNNSWPYFILVLKDSALAIYDNEGGLKAEKKLTSKMSQVIVSSKRFNWNPPEISYNTNPQQILITVLVGLRSKIVVTITKHNLTGKIETEVLEHDDHIELSQTLKTEDPTFLNFNDGKLHFQLPQNRGRSPKWFSLNLGADYTKFQAFRFGTNGRSGVIALKIGQQIVIKNFNLPGIK